MKELIESMDSTIHYFAIPFFVLLAFTVIYYVIIPFIQNGVKMSKNSPINIKKGDLVIYNKRYHEVLSSINNEYNLRSIDEYKTLVLKVRRYNIERVVS